ncbi:hypothetical protein BS17DRAFT_766095 [Gyrodon lividus]|nr:hypothetical protein BS17DRAFT_766095 [Gyrodon lividus]
MAPAIQVFNPLSKSSLASARVVPELESLVSTIMNDTSHNSTLVPEAPIQETPASNNTKTCTMPKLNKMRIGQAKNRHSSKFKTYLDVLGKGKQREYEDEADVLVATGKWGKYEAEKALL